jgi:hypothetical protein
MTPFAVSVLVVSGLPSLQPLQPPLAEFSSEILQDTALTSPQGLDRFLVHGAASCPTKAISTARALGGALMTLERVQLWLNQNPGVEARLFKKDTLADVKKHLTYAVPSTNESCKPPTLVEAWKWPAAMSGKLCAPKIASPTEAWFTGVKSQTAAAISVKPATDPCQPRVSIALFDSKGKNRLVVHADFGGAMSAIVVGDVCQIEFSYTPDLEAFKPQWKSCKG